MKVLAAVVVGAVTLLSVGCSGGSDSFDPNYKTEVKMTEAEKAKMAEEAKKQPMPGTISPSGQQGPQGLKMPPGKGGGK